jgi:hypothetical protein
MVRFDQNYFRKIAEIADQAFAHIHFMTLKK